MREIKFRAWVNSENLMFYNIEKITIGEYTSFSEPESEARFHVHNDYLMQYTGLKDKNWVEIYEGDILYCKKENYKGKVWFGNAGFITDAEGFGDDYLGASWCDFEVIGNIYENPELLEDK